MMLDAWARRWAIPAAAVADLREQMGLGGSADPVPQVGTSEAAVQSRVRLAASKAGMRLFRNNSGAGYDEAGNFMRWGLGNDSQPLNRVIKSADLIGIRPRVIQPADVGCLIGQFVSFEVKHAGWVYRGNDREQAQLNWANLIASLGGDARFVTSESQV